MAVSGPASDPSITLDQFAESLISTFSDYDVDSRRDMAIWEGERIVGYAVFDGGPAVIKYRLEQG